jgi:hypothetical protein
MHPLPAARCPGYRRALLAGALALHGALASAGPLPERFEASFVLSAQGVDIGTTRWQLAPLGDGRYVYEAHSETVGLARLLRDERIDERSEWRFADGAVRPLHYSYSRTGGGREREVEVRFDWAHGRVRNTLNGESWTMPLELGTLDKLVYLLALMRDLAHGLEEARYAVADGGHLKTYRLRVVRTERVATVMGELDTVVVERHREGDDRLALVWCAPALAYLPVLIEHRQDDGVVHATLTRVAGLPVR